MRQRWWGFGMTVASTGPYRQTICTSLQTDNHSNTSSWPINSVKAPKALALSDQVLFSATGTSRSRANNTGSCAEIRTSGQRILTKDRNTGGAPKIAPSCGWSGLPHRAWFPGPTRVHIQNGSSLIGSSVFAQLNVQQMERHTDHRKSAVIGHILC